ncbi:MAG: amidohydrolase family protein [Proteobacteria bacterium]|nr:amidohydrolase family protein [Pseudomonadota bacterium]
MGIVHYSNVDWIVAWDENQQSHSYLKGGDLVFDGNRITHIGKAYEGRADRVLSGSGLCLMPGLVDVHAHPAGEIMFRGIREDHNVREHYMNGLYERSCSYPIDPEDLKIGAEVSYADLMLSGVTTLVDIAFPYPGWTDVIERSGLRLYAAPGFNTARWHRDNLHELKYIENVEAGRSAFDAALKIVDAMVAHPSGRLSGMISPFQIDNNDKDMMVDSHAAARERGLPWTIHAAQAVLEHHTMIRRHGITPIQYLDELKLLGPGTIVGHALFIDQHSRIGWHTDLDLALLGNSGTAVAHCPTPFMRYGAVLEHFAKYKEAGVVMAIGTDTIPHNMLEDLRYASILGRIAGRDGHLASTSDVFHAGTVGGARALMRDDIGKLAVGAKADVVVVDTTLPVMAPLRDPIASLIHSAAERAVKDVYIDGELVVENHRVLTLNRSEAAGQLADCQARMEAGVPGKDYLGRSSRDIAPLILPEATF